MQFTGLSVMSVLLWSCLGTHALYFEHDTRKEAYRTEPILGELQCARMCAKDGHCRAINNNRNHLICELVEDSANLVPDATGWKHASNFSAIQNTLKSCSGIDVPDVSVCVPLASGDNTLVKQLCGNLSTPSNAVASSAERIVGTTVTFTCGVGYVGKGSSPTTCLAGGQWSQHTHSCEHDWPGGNYTLLQPNDTCPSGFVSGSRTWYMQSTGSSSSSTPWNLRGYVSDTLVEWHFCTRTSNSTSPAWPAGEYCILRQGGFCPSGFTEGSILFDEEDNTPSNRSQGTGVLPDGTYDTNCRLYFCCRADGPVGTAISLPVSAPFVLFPYKSTSCQQVMGVNSSSEHTYFDTETRYNADELTGETPYSSTGPPRWDIYHCYYS